MIIGVGFLNGCITEITGKDIEVTILKTYFRKDGSGITRFYMDAKIKNNQENPGWINLMYVTTENGILINTGFTLKSGEYANTIAPGHTLEGTFISAQSSLSDMDKNDIPLTFTYFTTPSMKQYTIEIPSPSSAPESENEQTWTNGTIALQDIQYTKEYSSKFGDYKDVEVWFSVDYDVHIDTQMTNFLLITNKGNIISCIWDSVGTNGVYTNEQFLYASISFSRTNSPGNFSLYLRNAADTSGFSNANMLMIDENVTSFTFTIVDAYGDTEYTIPINENIISNHNTEKISEKFVGNWKRETSEILSTFNSDGTYITEGKTYQWELESNKYIVVIGGTDYTYVFSNNNTTLTLNNIQKGTILIYIKQ
ncbi:MAG: hypothetical protein IMZ52_05540 [Actinobacteria bacterium]|nr:hypothetical protein [Actinomycetota bacterium]MBE3114109.1 hypothetical protein [Actinomycetota bacterium]